MISLMVGQGNIIFMGLDNQKNNLLRIIIDLSKNSVSVSQEKVEQPYLQAISAFKKIK